jgi:hypothetical protein
MFVSARQGSFRLAMERLEAHWNGKVEIDAQECKHTEALQI